MPDNTPAPARPLDELATHIERDCCDFGPFRASNHDMLVSFESRGMAGVEYVLAAMELSHDHEGVENGLSWVDLPDFIAQHNWENPHAVWVLGQFIDSALRDRAEARSLRAVPTPEAKAS